MVNKIQSRLGTKLSGKYKNTVAGIIFSVLSMMGLQDAVAQTTTFQDNLKKPNIELAKKDPVIEYMYTHIDTYYPDMKGYVDELFHQFESQTRLDTALVFIDDMYKNLKLHIVDPKQITGAIIYCLEISLLKGKFSNAYDSQITDETFEYIGKFDTQYKEFLKRYFARVQGRMEELLARIKQLDEQSKQLDEQSKQLDEQSKQLDEQSKQLDEDINKNFVDIENMMLGFTPADIQKSEYLQKLVIDTYNLTLRSKRVPSDHLLKLYNAATQK